MGVCQRNGRDKVTILASPGIADFGAWLEQLLAESTGKIGRGIVPVDAEAVGPATAYGSDRLFAYTRLAPAQDPAQDRAGARAAAAGDAEGATRPREGRGLRRGAGLYRPPPSAYRDDAETAADGSRPQEGGDLPRLRPALSALDRPGLQGRAEQRRLLANHLRRQAG